MKHQYGNGISIDVRRQYFARLLLTLFVSMQMLMAVHVHEATTIVSCDDCLHHVSHAGHFSAGQLHTGDCVLCQFASLPFVAATLLVFAFFQQTKKKTSQLFVVEKPQQWSAPYQLRGPPAVL